MTSLQTVLRLQGYRKTALVSYPHTPAGCCRSRSQNDSSRCRWRRDSNIVRSYKFQNQTSRTHLHLRREEKKTHTFEKPTTTHGRRHCTFISHCDLSLLFEGARITSYNICTSFIYCRLILFRVAVGAGADPSSHRPHCGRFKSAYGDRRPFILQFYSQWQIYLILYVFVL